ncbi:MAG: slipin family protein [Anaerolineae bacterium]|nr:slipin family protein [Anaerolineae bacterium]
MRKELILKDTHRALWYENGVLVKVLEAGRYKVPHPRRFFVWQRQPKVDFVLVDIRERDLTIKGQEVLTSDKVAVRVSIVVQFRVSDPKAAIHQVENYEDRLYTDVQLAARRSLATMTLEDILTNRNQLSEDILTEVKETASNYGVAIIRADVKDLVFPGNLQQIMNQVLTAERLSEAQLVEARTKAEVKRIEAQTQAETRRLELEAQLDAERRQAESAAAVQRIETEAEVEALQGRGQAASTYAEHPELLQLEALETLRELGRTANARIYINFDQFSAAGLNGGTE